MAIALDLDDVTDEIRQHIGKNCVIKPKKSNYEAEAVPIPCFAVNRTTNNMYVPMRMWRDLYDEFPTPSHIETSVKALVKPLTEATDTKKRRDQDVVLKEAISQLKTNRSVFLALYTSFGKTFCGSYLAAYFKRKTVVLCHSDLIKKQWPEEFAKFTTAKVQIVKGDEPLDPKVDVYIIGIIKACKLPREAFKDIGMVIVDEAHMCTVAAFTKALLKFTPDYLIALSATPDRADGLHSLFVPYFGKWVKPKAGVKKYVTNGYIGRLEEKEFTVIKYETDYKPTVELIFRGGRWVPDWQLVIDSTESNEAKQAEMAQLAIDHPDDKIIILCNRTVNVNGIYEILKEKGESVEKLVGAQKKWNRDARILVAGMKKAGVGFNDPDLTMEIIVSDAKDIRQYEGRLRTTGCTIYHVVDNYAIFESHWVKGNEPWYREKGATIIVRERKTETDGGRRGSGRSIKTAIFDAPRMMGRSSLIRSV